MGNLQLLSAGLSHSSSCSLHGKGHSDLGGHPAGPSHGQPNLDSATSLSITEWDTNYLCPSPPWSAKAAPTVQALAEPRLNIISAWNALQEMAASAGTGRHEGREYAALPEGFISTVVLWVWHFQDTALTAALPSTA